MMAVEQKLPYLVELVGPAGAGKSSLIQALTKRSEKFLIGYDLQLRRIEHIPIFLSHIPFLLQEFLRQGQPSRRFTWDEIKSIVYLKGGPKILDQQAINNGMTILLDHGPVFKLATLNAFGPEILNSQAFENWWQSMFKHWSSELDMVVWLDAPDKILVQRINQRSQRHAVKGKPEREAYSFLARYRTSYKQILAKLTTCDRLTLLRFDTSQVPFKQIIDEILITHNIP